MKINVNCEIYDLPTTGASKEGQNMFIYKKKKKKLCLFFHTSENNTKCIVIMYTRLSTKAVSFMASESEVQGENV